MARTLGLSRRSKITKVILVTLATGGLITIGALAPNMLGLVAKSASKYGRVDANRRYYIKSMVSKLVTRGLIKLSKNKDGKTYLGLTEKGNKELIKYRLDDLRINKPLRWDKKWRVVMFDIKEIRRGDRDNLRVELVSLGFVRLQNSVWVYPYDCDEFIMLLKTQYSFGKSMLYLVVEKLENDGWLREIFEI